MPVKIELTEAEANMLHGVMANFEKQQRFFQDYGKMGMAKRIKLKIEEAEKETSNG